MLLCTEDATATFPGNACVSQVSWYLGSRGVALGADEKVREGIVIIHLWHEIMQHVARSTTNLVADSFPVFIMDKIKPRVMP